MWPVGRPADRIIAHVAVCELHAELGSELAEICDLDSALHLQASENLPLQDIQ
jgi:hypothetical protein